MRSSDESRLLQARYELVAWLYDVLDYPWERLYSRWRRELLEDVHGTVLEAGVGTGRNLKYYHPDVELTAIDISAAMLARARKRACVASCRVELRRESAARMETIPAGRYDWVISTFMCCVMPDALQLPTLEQFQRVLKPGGRFRLLEMVYSQDPRLRRRQEFISGVVECLYGARFDRNTLAHVEDAPKLKVLNTRFLKDDVYLLIEGVRLQ